MKFYIVVLVTLFSTTVSAQVNSSKTDVCSCTTSISLKTPIEAEEDSVSAQVIVEINIDSNCTYSNPVVIKGASAGRNKVALDYAQQYINAVNKCECRRSTCTTRKMALPIKFLSEADE